jgi:hypothetical protein
MQEEVLINPDISPTFSVSNSQRAPYGENVTRTLFSDTFSVSPACLVADR